MAEAPSKHLYTNGHLTPSRRDFDGGAVAPSSESDLSEAIDIPKPTPPFRHESSKDSENGYNSREGSVSSHEEDAIGSDDADFEMDSPAPPEIQVTHDSRSSSQDSRRPSKRKAGFEDDEHIMNNPELYGIRRSVSVDGHMPAQSC